MRHLPCLGFAMLAACAGAPPVVRTPAVPLGPPTRAADLTRDQGPRAGADHSPPVHGDATGPGDVVVSVRNLPQWEPPVSPPPKESPAPEQQAMEPTAAPTWSSGGADPGPQAQYQSYGYQSYSQQPPPPQHHEPWFPVGTFVGIGIGSAIDHHHGHCHGNGAWIGGSIGLMFDVARMWH